MFETAAATLLLLKAAPDNPEWFPKGKWATLQAMEQKLEEKAKEFWR